MGYVAHLAREADLADPCRVGGDRPVRQRRRHRDAHGEVGGGVVDAHTASGGDEHVAEADGQAEELVEHAAEDGHAIGVEPVDRTARPRSLATTARCPRHERLHLGQQRTPPLDRGHDRRPRSVVAAAAEEHGGRVVDLDEAALAHVEEAELTGGSEAVLDAAQDAEGVVAVTLERAHDIDEVLEDARAREAAVLGHVADEDECRTGAPGGLGEQRRTLAHLSDRARRRPEPRVAHGLDRVDRDHSRRNGVEVAGDRGDGLLVDHVQAAVDSPEALGPLAHLRLGLLGRDEQRRGAGAGCRGERLQHQRRLADTGLAAEQERRTRHEPAAEDAVELADAGRPVRDLGRRHLGERDGRVAPTLGHERRELGVEGLDTARTHR